MIIKQLSIFLENEPGSLYKITSLIAAKNINLRALCVAETANFGILRFITASPEEAKALLEDAGLSVQIRDVLCVKISDSPGGLSKPLGVLANEGIDVKYLYAFVSTEEANTAYAVMRVDDIQCAAEVLTRNGHTGIGMK